MIQKRFVKAATAFLISAALVCSADTSFAASRDKDIDSLIQEQEKILQELNERKTKEKNDELTKQIQSLTKQIEELKNNKKDSYDTKGAIESIAGQLALLHKRIEEQNDRQTELMEAIKKINDRTEEKLNSLSKSADESSARKNYRFSPSSPSSEYLINPGPEKKINYTQDAINSQGRSTMVFAYAPDQLYKVYCRAGYLTDMAFKKGEKIAFVGGGDTTAWAVNSTTVDGVPHLYVKPTVETSTTNLIVTTDKRSYQIILTTDNQFYNPMIRWTYEGDEHIANLLKQEKEEKTVIGNLSAVSYDALDFDYKVTGKANTKPSMVFSDGEKTMLKFSKMPKKMPAVFVRTKGHKGVQLVNFKIKDNFYIIDSVVDEAEIRFSDTETLKIKHER